MRWLVALALLGWPAEALAYRPFDGTDAAVSALEAKVRDMKKRARQAIRSAAHAAC